jgi:hypothetical protein
MEIAASASRASPHAAETPGARARRAIKTTLVAALFHVIACGARGDHALTRPPLEPIPAATGASSHG